MKNKWIVSLLITALITVLAACSGGEEAKQENSQEKAASEENAKQAELPEPDLEGIPEVVATVNEEKITKEEFTQTYEPQFQRAAMQSQMTGQKLDQDQFKQQIVDSLVGQELLIQEANNRGFKVTEEEKNKTLEDLAKQNQMESKDKLIEALEKQGMKKEEIMKQLETQIKVEKLITSESGEIKVSDEELQEAYDQLKKRQEEAGGEGKVPSFEEVKPSLEQQLVYQKESQAIQKLVESLREKAEVKVNI